MKANELILKAIFCCMACDGEIASKEIKLVKNIADNTDMFKDIDAEKRLNEYVAIINKQGLDFLSSFISELAEAKLTTEEELQLVKLAIQTIEADEHVEYSEISFFKRIRAKLNISDDEILAELPDREDYLLPDAICADKKEFNVSFGSINFNDIKE